MSHPTRTKQPRLLGKVNAVLTLGDRLHLRTTGRPIDPDEHAALTLDNQARLWTRLLVVGVALALPSWSESQSHGGEPERRPGAMTSTETPLEMDKRKSMLQPARKPETGPNLRPPGTHRSAPNVDWRTLPPNYEPHWSIDPDNLFTRRPIDLLPRLGREYIEARDAAKRGRGRTVAPSHGVFGREPPREPDLQFAVPEIPRVRPGELERDAARQKIAELGPPSDDLDEERGRVSDLSEVEWEIYSAEKRAAYEREVRRFERLNKPRRPVYRVGR